MDLVKKLRLERGWTQEHLAGASGVGRATIQRIERGAVVPSKEVALALADALQVEARVIREGAGLAAAVLRVSAITWERDARSDELARLPPVPRAIFASFYRARKMLKSAEQAVSDVDAQSRAQHARWLEALDAVKKNALALRVNPDDGEARTAFLAAFEALESLNKTGTALVQQGVAKAGEAMDAIRVFNNAGLAVTNLLMQFV